MIGPAHSALDGVPDGVRLPGAVPMSTPAGRETIETALAGSHFLLLPTLVDCCPISLAEANSFGVPCLTTSIAGIPTVVRNDVNGRMFDPSAAPGEYADYIVAMLADPRGYERPALRAHAQTLNWRTAASTVLEMMERL